MGPLGQSLGGLLGEWGDKEDNGEGASTLGKEKKRGPLKGH